MQERELLELAAKAAGVKVEHDGKFAFPYGLWNPLDDDGDALRLAVKLRIEVEWLDFNTVYASRLRSSGRLVVVKGDDPYTAARRTIVYAAAEIGKAMK